MEISGKTGKCIIVSAPSGAGKTTIVRSLLAQGLRLTFSVSATNRSKRSFEVDGKDYFFISMEEFQEKVEQDAFIEWEEVYPGMVYGTLKSEIERIWALGNIAIFDVDVEGGLKIKKIFGQMLLAVFVMPPSVAALHQRLKARNSETKESFKARIAKSEHEITYAFRFDKIIINDDLPKALDEAEKLVEEFLK